MGGSFHSYRFEIAESGLSHGELEACSDYLLDLGAWSVSLQSHDHGPCLSVLCSSENAPAVRNALVSFCVNETIVHDDEWKNSCYHNFEYIEVTDSFTVAAPGYVLKNGPPLVARIDPSHAFGDGGHATTKMCAQFIIDHVKRHGPCSVLDAGAGTGILSILARKLGCDPVVAVEIDPAGAEQCRFNLALNECDDVAVVEGDIALLGEGEFSCIVGNLLTLVIEKVLDVLVSRLAENGVMILSGIGVQWRDLAADLFVSRNLEIYSWREMDGWIAVLMGRNV